jgi:transposase
MGLLLCCVVHAAHISDNRGCRSLLWRMHRQFRLLVIFVDGGYKKTLINWALATFCWTMQVVKRSDTGKFTVLPMRWVVERTFAWLGNYRIHSKDYHHNPRHAEATIYATSVNIMLKRLQKT